MPISYGLPKARCPCSNGRNKTAQTRVPPKGPVGLFQQKAERNQNKISMVVPRGGVPQASNINALHWQTASRGSLDPQRFSGAVANHPALQNKPCRNVQSSHRAKAKRTRITYTRGFISFIGFINPPNDRGSTDTSRVALSAGGRPRRAFIASRQVRPIFIRSSSPAAQRMRRYRCAGVARGRASRFGD
jgi:hypothetical protein